MTFKKQALVEAIESGLDLPTANDDGLEPSAPETIEQKMTLEEVIAMDSFNDAERPVQIRGLEYRKAISKTGNPYVKMTWQTKYLDHNKPEWRDKNGVNFDGQGQLVFDYDKEFGIKEEDTYIVRSKKVKGDDGKEYSQWISFCHIDAYDEVA